SLCAVLYRNIQKCSRSSMTTRGNQKNIWYAKNILCVLSRYSILQKQQTAKHQKGIHLLRPADLSSGLSHG
ncbi:hypothetical protein, partial [Clostridium sp. MSTE9]|uniref:hypothetical protein n=1 Tax=Clostridium sp. (strain MSTE9) TaxID=1105031 RepID=UPI001A99BC3E